MILPLPVRRPGLPRPADHAGLTVASTCPKDGPRHGAGADGFAQPGRSRDIGSKVAVVVVVGVEALAAAYVSLIAFVMSDWMVDEGRAFRMSDTDWVLTGGLRLLGWSLVGAAFACGVRWVNRWFGWVRPPGFLSCLPLVLAACIVLASAIGAATFVIDKPFM